MTLSSLYNSLHEVHRSDEIVKSKDGLLPALAKCLQSHNLHSYFDIRLVHKHFDLADGERVVGFTTERAKTSVVVGENGVIAPDIADEYLLPPTVSPASIIPTDFIITRTGAEPYEFGYSAGPASCPTVSIPPTFLDEWTALLEAQGIDDDRLLGLTVRDSDVVPPAWETSSLAARVNELILNEEPPPGMQTIYTSWIVNEPGSEEPMMGCCSCAVSNTYHKSCTAK